MTSWRGLTLISLSISGLFVAVLAGVMIAKDGSHVMYCPSLPAYHLLPCLPSSVGIAAAVILTILGAVPIFVFFFWPLAMWESKRRDP